MALECAGCGTEVTSLKQNVQKAAGDLRSFGSGGITLAGRTGFVCSKCKTIACIRCSKDAAIKLDKKRINLACPSCGKDVQKDVM
jgi:DNA-directed RNA polymerase subunit RPC12/RpoP